jgi:Protein of unknown function (DUF3572)
MLSPHTNEAPNDDEALALAAQRFLDITGLDADELRARAGQRSLLAATLAFLESHEPDLVAVAQTIGTAPELLVQARMRLER